MFGLDPNIIAALVALIGVAISILVGTQSSRRQIREEMRGKLVISALEHLVGGTQQRSVGISALTMFLYTSGGNTSERQVSTVDPQGQKVLDVRLKEYGSAVARLLYSQLVYLLVHAGQRGYTHEVTNIIAIGNMLLGEELLSFLDDRQKAHLQVAMKEYLSSGNQGKICHLESVYMLQNTIIDSWLPRLKQFPKQGNLFTAPNASK